MSIALRQGEDGANHVPGMRIPQMIENGLRLREIAGGHRNPRLLFLKLAGPFEVALPFEQHAGLFQFCRRRQVMALVSDSP